MFLSYDQERCQVGRPPVPGAVDVCSAAHSNRVRFRKNARLLRALQELKEASIIVRLTLLKAHPKNIKIMDRLYNCVSARRVKSYASFLQVF